MTDPTPADGFTVTRRFAAPPERVFAARTDPAEFSVWFGTAGTTVTDTGMDVRPGGRWQATMRLAPGVAGPEAVVMAWSGTYREVDPPGRLVLTMADRPGEELELLTVVLSAVEGGTEMLFEQSGGHMDAAGYERTRQGWEGFFADLAGLVER